MNTLLASLIALISLAWAWDGLGSGATSGAATVWAMRQEGLNLSGFLSIGLMSLAMLLAARPAWLETPLGGLDRMYRAHKWAGILAVAFAVLHWLIEMSDDILKALVGREGRAGKAQAGDLLEALRHPAEEMGEWAIYGVLAMLALTLWKRFPYQPWRLLHQAMPLIYLMLAFHAALLAPTNYWRQPAGALLGLLLAGGIYGALHSLSGRIGRSRRSEGEIIAIEQPSPDIVGVRCRLGPNWRGHRPGQFAFVTFDPTEGPHPFTLASANRSDRIVEFQIKALGGYTRQLGHRLDTGRTITLEGPYGHFDMARRDPRAMQFWVAGGIGITPFLAWLDALQTNPAQAPNADLHYCTSDREHDPFIARLTALCAVLPCINLHLHGAAQGERLTAVTLLAGKSRNSQAEIWFCGPQGLAASLKLSLNKAWPGNYRFHQEAFEMR